ncbi:MAG: dihydrodipicolinate synthase family protein [Thaumarchaeota archaeon]|nr:dihydrodipicolinate synthase family protein [Nitrososphaerota archaeon]
MRPLRSSEIRGNWATLLLPIRSDQTIDYDLLGAEISHFGVARVNGVYSNGTAGEFYTQTEEEFDRVNRILAEACERLRIPFQIGVSHMSSQLSLDRLRRARAWEPSGFQVILPDWFPPTMDDIHRFLDVMEAAADPIPLIVYNPPHAKRRLVPAEWIEIVRRHPGVAGIKVAGGDAAWYEAMRPVLDQVSVFIPGHTLATGLSRGAQGAYSNVACLSPGGAQGWYELCQSDLREGLKMEEKIGGFFSREVMPLITVRKLPNMAADKALAVAGGWLPGLSTLLRWPYEGATEEEAIRIGTAARAALPELFPQV